MSLEDVRAALQARLTASDGCAIASSRIAWAGNKFTPGTTRWYRPTFLPGQPRAAAAGPDAANRVIVLFQVDIFDPPNKGEDLTATEAERIRTFFKRGTALTKNSQTVICRQAYRGAVDTSDPAWLKIPVIIEAWADVSN